MAYPYRASFRQPQGDRRLAPAQVTAAAIAGFLGGVAGVQAGIGPVVFLAVLFGVAGGWIFSWRWRQGLLFLFLGCVIGMGYASLYGSFHPTAASPAPFSQPSPHTLYLFSGYLPADEAALLDGIVFSEKSALSKDMSQALIASGTVHVVDFSGYKIALFAFASFGVLLLFLPRRVTYIAVIILLVLLTAISGAQIASFRAVIVAFLGLSGREFGRSYSMGYALLWTVFAMTLLDPMVMFSAGLQLSVASVLGIAYLLPLVRRWFHLKEEGPASLTGRFREHAAVSVAVQLAAAPVMLGTFGSMSLASFIANGLVMPFLPLLLGSGLLLAFCGVLAPPLATVIALALSPLLAYQIAVIHFFAIFSLPLTASLSFPAAIFYYALLLIAVFHFRSSHHEKESP